MVWLVLEFLMFLESLELLEVGDGVNCSLQSPGAVRIEPKCLLEVGSWGADLAYIPIYIYTYIYIHVYTWLRPCGHQPSPPWRCGGCIEMRNCSRSMKEL